MIELKKHSKVKYIIVILIITFVLSFRIFNLPFGKNMHKFLQEFLYLSIFSLWSISVYYRIIHVRIRNYLTAVLFLIFFWMSIRLFKHNFTTDPFYHRILWYFFYLPIVSIPLLGFFISLSIGKNDKYITPKIFYIFSIISLLLFILVLTNDLHNFVFVISPEEMLKLAPTYTYGLGYYIIMFWIVTICTLFIITLISKSHIPSKNKFIFAPIIPIIISLVYSILYVKRLPWIKVVAGDMTLFYCLMIATTFEFCIISGLIPSNSNYKKILEMTKTPIWLTDKNMNIEYSIPHNNIMCKDILKKAAENPFMLDKKNRLLGKSLKNNYVFWLEDISEQLQILEELSCTNMELKNYNYLLEEEIKQKEIKYKLQEKHKIFRFLEEKTRAQAYLIKELSENLRESTDKKEAKKILWKILVIGTFIKRYSNIFFIANEHGEVPLCEIEFSIKESMKNIEIMDIKCAYITYLDKTIPVTMAGKIINFYEKVLETSIDSLASIVLRLLEDKGVLNIKIMVSTEENLKSIIEYYPTCHIKCDEDNTWYLHLKVEE